MGRKLSWRRMERDRFMDEARRIRRRLNHGTGRLIHRMTEKSEARSSGNSRWMMVIVTMAQVQGGGK